MNLFGLKTLLKTCIKTLEKMKILALKILVKNQLKYGLYIAPYEICPLAAGKGKFALPVDRPVDRPTVTFLTVEPLGRSRLVTESRALCRSTDPVDRGHFQRAELSGRSTVPVDRPPAKCWRARLCTSVDRTGRPTTAAVDRQ